MMQKKQQPIIESKNDETNGFAEYVKKGYKR